MVGCELETLSRGSATLSEIWEDYHSSLAIFGVQDSCNIK